MSTEILRRTATLMRERAEAATPGPWEARGNPGFGWVALYSDESTIPEGESFPSIEQGGTATDADTEHIASWHPAVALAVADWLDGLAAQWDVNSTNLRQQMRLALTVARAYLEGDA